MPISPIVLANSLLTISIAEVTASVAVFFAIGLRAVLEEHLYLIEPS